MGSWSVCCGISNIAIKAGNDCVLLPIRDNSHQLVGYTTSLPALLPIFGKYDDYGGIEDIIHDDNTELIANYFGVTIEEFCNYILNNENTYDREDAKVIHDKMSNQDKARMLNFMWIDRKVYDYMIKFNDDYHLGYNDYGTPEFMELFGFKLVGESKEGDNYDVKRFKHVYQKDDLILYSDGNTLLAGRNTFIYHFGHGDNTSIETYFEVPESLHHLKTKGKSETWKLWGVKKQRDILRPLVGYSTIEDLKYDEIVSEKLGYTFPRVYTKDLIMTLYYPNLTQFGDRIVELINLMGNLSAMSGDIRPFKLHLTPQCGEHSKHQEILEEFAKINKSYCEDEDE